jgi:hypothetical protein
MLMLTLLMPPVNHFVTMSAGPARLSPATVVTLVLVVVAVIFVWALRQLQPAFVVVAELLRIVVLTAVAAAVIIGALVLLLATAVVH